ncbi:MAG: hypothetical protein JW863_22990 [Chitinispirillaceae bacterium]|nr:hypothetical protein [Chitinispirillaceae bacterium]
MNIRLLFSLLLAVSFSVAAQKEVYLPQFIRNMDLNSSSSQWCHARSRESDNVVVFWESGFGSDPSTTSGSYRVDMNALLDGAEKNYAFYRDSLKFAIEGSSVTDRYKLMIFLLYSTDWTANGSGQDDLVGSLHVSVPAANNKTVVAHEMGHCFQYITGCDGDGGYQYGLGDNGAGGNGFWEQCAQWMSFKVYPEQQFTAGDFRNYIKSNHLHILHETPRYANYFLPDYWTWKHDLTFLGTLWRDSKRPEDPVETYKRLNSLSQAQFNDEIYEHAALLTTWDLPHIRSYGERYIDSREQVKMNSVGNNYWQIDKSVCIENYGYNCIKLNAPEAAFPVTVHFKGDAGAGGFRTLNVDQGGWRFGFVALLKDGTRAYSETGRADVADGTNPEQSLAFNCPDNCSKLWLVVSGAPQEHWKHEWDDNNSNDEQWPYRVSFEYTNLLGEITATNRIVLNEHPLYGAPVISQRTVCLPDAVSWKITDLAGRLVQSGFGRAINFASYATGGYILHYQGEHLAIMKCSTRR